MADIDHFKQINDTYGHAIGDRMLKAVAQTIQQSCRTFDTPARYGGEEFVIVLPETNRESACIVAERIRSGVAALRIPFSSGIAGKHQVQVTVSIGIARFSSDGLDAAGLLEHADSNLYAAKQEGRNRVASFRKNNYSATPVASEATGLSYGIRANKSSIRRNDLSAQSEPAEVAGTDLVSRGHAAAT